MAIIKPFHALRPVPDRAKVVSSVPYDVVDTDEARIMAKGNPFSFLHVIRSEIDLPEGTDLYSDAVYEQAAKNLKALIERKVLIKEKTSKIYVYRIIMGEHKQLGVACCCSVEEYDNDIIKKHEYTRKEKEDDRVRHMLSISSHAGPVLMTYRGRASINSIVDREIREKPLYDFVSDDGTQHTLWGIDAPEEIVEAFQDVPCLYIADGHHRAAGASRVRREMQKRYGQSKGDEDFNYFLAVLFPAEQLRIFPYNRWVMDLGGQNEREFLEAVRNRFKVAENGSSIPSMKGYLGMYLKGKWYELSIRKDGAIPVGPVKSLDLSVFQNELLDPVLGIKDQKRDKRINFVGGPDSVSRLEKRVNEEGGVAFSFYPVSIDELLAVADAGMTMPPKSTWFAPKLRSGLLVHQF